MIDNEAIACRLRYCYFHALEPGCLKWIEEEGGATITTYWVGDNLIRMDIKGKNLRPCSETEHGSEEKGEEEVPV